MKQAICVIALLFLFSFAASAQTYCYYSPCQFGWTSTIPQSETFVWTNSDHYYLESPQTSSSGPFSAQWPSAIGDTQYQVDIPITFSPSTPGTYSGSVSATYIEELPSCCQPVTITVNINAAYAVPGILYPKYQIQSIIYSTPGTRSSSGFVSSTTDGTTTTASHSFTKGFTETFSYTGGFLGIGSTISWSYGQTATHGDSTSTTGTITQGTGVANATNPSGPNSINHQQDLFIILLNPAVSITQNGPTSVSYSFGTQAQGASDPNPGQPQLQDQVEVYAQAMMANGSGLTSVPLSILEPRVVDGQTLAGLAAICADQTYYPDNCPNDPNGQCGCTPDDFSQILTADPLLNFASTESPLDADTSGPAACTNPTPSESCRYVPIMTQNNGSDQVNELLAGPEEQGGNIPVNSFTQTDATQTAQTYTESHSYTVGSSWKQQYTPLGNGPTLQSQTQFTYSDSESSGAINGTANSNSVTLSSSTVGCYQEIPIFEDTVYHTFVFQQPSGNYTCP